MAGGMVGTEMRVTKDPSTRGGAVGRPRARPWKGEEKGNPTGKKTTGLYGPEGREMPCKNSGECLRVSFLGGRGTWAAGVIIGPCLGPSRGVFGAQMVNSMKAGILSVLQPRFTQGRIGMLAAIC